MRITKILPMILVGVIGIGLTACDQLPIRNPLKTRPTVKLGALPEIESSDKTVKSAQVVRQWHSGIAFSPSSAVLYPKILPTVEAGFVYRADHKGNLIALHKQTGKQKWKVKTKYKIASGPTIVGDSLLVGTNDAKVVAFDKSTGKMQWVSVLSSEVLAPPKGNEKIIVVNTLDGKTTGLNPQNGESLWTQDSVIPILLLRGTSAPQLAGDYAVSGLANGKLVAVNTESGALVWESVVASPKGRSELHRMVDIQADPVIDGNDIFVASFQGKIAKVHLETGKTQWQRDVSVYHNMSVDEDAVYITDEHNNLLALDKATGITLWKQEGLSKRYITAPSSVDNYVIVGDRGGYIHWLDKKTGQLKGHHAVGNRILSDLIVEGDTILVSTQNGNLSVFKFLG